MRYMLKILRNCVIAFFGIYLFNLLVSGFSLSIGLNAVNTLTVGLLGVPGFATLLLLRLMSRT